MDKLYVVHLEHVYGLTSYVDRRKPFWLDNRFNDFEISMRVCKKLLLSYFFEIKEGRAFPSMYMYNHFNAVEPVAVNAVNLGEIDKVIKHYKKCKEFRLEYG